MSRQTGSLSCIFALVAALILCRMPATGQRPEGATKSAAKTPAKAPPKSEPKDEGKKEAPPPAEPKAEEPGSISEIPDRMQSTAAIVRTANADSAPHERILDIERTLPEYGAGIRVLLDTSRRLLKTEKSPGMIRELRGAWNVARRRLDSWQNLLKKRSAALQEDFLALKRQEEAWASVTASAPEYHLPPAMLAEIQALQKSIHQAKEDVVTRRNEALKLQGSISSLGIEIDAMEDELDVAAGDERWSLFRLDGPPIWKPDQAVAAHKEAVRTKADDSQPLSEVVTYYVRSVSAVVLAQAGWFLVILTALLLLRRRAANWLHDEDASVRTLALVVSRPVSLALLLSLLGGWILYTKAPYFLLEGMWLLLLIPLVRTMPLILSADMKTALWLLAALYFLDGVIRLLPTYATSTRVLALALHAIAAAGMWRLNKRLRTRVAPSSWRTATLACIRLGFVLLVVAIISEVVGATALSRFLQGAVLKCVYAAVILYGALPVFRGLVHLLLRRRSKALLDSTPALERRLSGGLSWIAGIMFVVVTIRAFEIDEPVTVFVKSVLNYKFSIGAIDFTAGAILTFVLVIFATSLISRIIRFFLATRFIGRPSMGRGAGEAISKLLHYAVLTAGFLFALGAAGIDLNKFTILAGGLGVGVGFGMQNIINNFVSGLILLFERPLQVGDKITVGPTSGEVKDIGIRASTIRTWEGADVVIPNASLISGDFTNWTLSDNRRRGELSVGVAHGTDPERVIMILKEAAHAHPKILSNPEPAALFIGFGESSLNFLMRYWTLLDDHVEVGSEIYVAVNKRLLEEGIKIPLPQRELNVRSSDGTSLPSGQTFPAEAETREVHNRGN